jgi:hypothetical protein
MLKSLHTFEAVPVEHVFRPQHQQRLILTPTCVTLPAPPMLPLSSPARRDLPSASPADAFAEPACPIILFNPMATCRSIHIDDIDSRYRSALDFLSRSLAHPPTHSLTQHPRAQVRAVALIASPLRVIARGGREAHRHAPPIVQAEPIAVEHRVGRDVVVHDEAWVPRRPEEGAWRRGR